MISHHYHLFLTGCVRRATCTLVTQSTSEENRTANPYMMMTAHITFQPKSRAGIPLSSPVSSLLFCRSTPRSSSLQKSCPCQGPDAFFPDRSVPQLLNDVIGASAATDANDAVYAEADFPAERNTLAISLQTVDYAAAAAVGPQEV